MFPRAIGLLVSVVVDVVVVGGVVDWSGSNRFLLIGILAQAIKDDVEYVYRLGT